jgi:hypothetical protein
VRVSRRSFVLSAIPAVFGLLVLILCFVSMAVRVADMPRFENTQERTLDLDGGRYIFYAEWDNDAHDGDVRCTVRDEAGTSLHVEIPAHRSSYSLLFRAGRELRSVFVPRPGKHVVACDGAPGVIALGRNMRVTMVIGFVTFGVGVLASLIWAFVLVGRRKR